MSRCQTHGVADSSKAKPTLGAAGGRTIEVEFGPTTADPFDEPGRRTADEPVGGHVRCYEGSRSDESKFADRHAGQYDRTGAKCRTSADNRLEQPVRRFVSVRHLGIPRRPRAAIVGEDDARSNEHAVFERDAVPKRDPVLHGDPVSDPDRAFDIAVATDVAVGSDLRALQDVSEGPYARPESDVGRLNERGGMDERRVRARRS